MPLGRAVPALAAATTSPSNPRIVAVVSRRSVADGSYTFATTLTGGTWTYQGTLASSHSVRPLLWRGGATSELLLGSVYPWWSGNLGGSWTAFHPGPTHVDIRGIYTNSTHTRVWAVADGDSYDGQYAIITSSWSAGVAPATATQVSDLGINSLQQFFVAPIKRGTSSPSTRWLLTGGMDNYGGCSANGGSSWSYYNPPGSVADHLAVLQACVPMGTGCNPSTSRAYFFNIGRLWRSTTLWSASSCAGVGWTLANYHPGVAAPWSSHSIALRPGFPGSVYVANSGPNGVVQVSTDGGDTPFTATAPLPDDARPVSLYVTGSGAIIAGSGRAANGQGTQYPPRGIYRLEPGGSWVPWGLNATPPEFVNAITATGTGGTLDTFWAATTSGIWRKAGLGSWTLVLSTTGYGASDVAIDPQNSNRVYVGQGLIDQVQEHRGGVLFTDDGGASWCSLTSGWLPHATPIADVEVDPYDSSRIWVATFGAGVWAYDGAGAPPSCP
ncbi:MAG: hypothetical protein IT379_26440 [Deltaproteobacteria bacterium]|nr:hypothetical protein [Deltaproteobacteria bacterium]